MTRLFRFGILLLLGAVAYAQHYRFRHFGPDQGLNTAVNAILQDRTGFLWVGTGNGLFRYDGVSFQRFGAVDGLPGSLIRSIAEAPDGTLWIVTGNGLARSRRGGFEVVDSGPAGQSPGSLAIDAHGGLYLGYARGLLAAPDASDFQPVAGVPSQPVGAILAEENGQVWFGCGASLCLLSDQQVHTYDSAAGLPPDRWLAILRDREGTLWVRGEKHLSVLAPGANRFIARDTGLALASAYGAGLLQDNAGRILTATAAGLATWSDGSWRMTTVDNGLESNAVTAIAQDREGALWIGMWGAGVARWPSPERWTNWTTADGLVNSVVWGIERTHDGPLWLATDGGLMRFTPGGASRTWSSKNGLCGDRVKAVSIAPDGGVWAACNPGGISRVDPRTLTIRSWGESSGLADLRVTAIYIDPEDRLWASTADGLFRSDGLAPGLRFTKQSLPGPEHAGYGRAITDRDGNIWVASTHGLLAWKSGQWTRYTSADGLRADALRTLMEHSDGSIWVAYRDPLGVSRLTFAPDGMKVEHLTESAGLPSDYVLFLGLDRNGQVWVGTDRGAATGQLERWRIWSHEEGLLSDDCSSNAFFPDEDGGVWIGTLKGLSRFVTGERIDAPVPPTAAITSVRFGEHNRDTIAAAAVPAGDNDFQVRFAALTFASERSVRVRYRLAGIDSHWNETTQREARYCNLPPGSYTFEVAARVGEGQWTTKMASISFRILPPWWQTWWFRASIVLAVVGVFAIAVRFRVRALRRENRRLDDALRAQAPSVATPRTAIAPSPHVPVHQDGPLSAPVSVVPRGPLRVLLAEDNPVNQKLAQRAIEKMGHEIVVVDNGHAAVRAHIAEHFDLVFMDLQMPEMDGFQATTAIRSREGAAAHTPIVAMTAHAMEGDRERCLAAGMDDYISKPVDLRALAALLERVQVGAAQPVVSLAGRGNDLT